MTRALMAAAKSQLRAAIDRVRLEPAEAVRVFLALALEHAATAEIDRRGLNVVIDDLLASGHGEPQ